VWGVLLGCWGLGGGERDLGVSIVGTMTWAVMSELSLVVYVHVKGGYYSYANDML